MRNAERVVLYPIIGLCLLLALRPAGLGSMETAARATTAAPQSTPPTPAATPLPASVGVVDLYTISDELIKTEEFDTPRKAEQKRHTETLGPMETELQELDKFLRTADPKDEANQEKYRTFQTKRQTFTEAQQRAQADYSAFISKQFSDAYAKARTAAVTLAKSRGFAYMIVSRNQDQPIDTADPQRVLEELQLRPVALAPEEANLTEAVLVELKLKK